MSGGASGAPGVAEGLLSNSTKTSGFRFGRFQDNAETSLHCTLQVLESRGGGGRRATPAARRAPTLALPRALHRRPSMCRLATALTVAAAAAANTEVRCTAVTVLARPKRRRERKHANCFYRSRVTPALCARDSRFDTYTAPASSLVS